MSSTGEKGRAWNCTLLGQAATKKNHSMAVWQKGRLKILPSPQFRKWSQIASPQLQIAKTRRPVQFDGPVSVRAVFYMARRGADLINLMQAISDILEGAGIVENDRQIESWDGSRQVFSEPPARVFLEIEPMHGNG